MFNKITYNAWTNRYSNELLALILSKEKCVCCGSQAQEFDHITPLLLDRSLSRNGRTRVLEFERGLLQPICTSCNTSKANDSMCNLHKKYLGIWNYLPALGDMEQ